MGRLCHQPIRELKAHFNLETMVETGAEHGYGIYDALRVGFNHIVSCEINRSNYERTIQYHGNNPKVQVLLGSSKELMPEMIDKSVGNILFWLDAHLAPERGTQPLNLILPLKDELIEIKNKRGPIVRDVILADDLVLFNSAFCREKELDLTKWTMKKTRRDVTVAFLSKAFECSVFIDKSNEGTLCILPPACNFESERWVKIH